MKGVRNMPVVHFSVCGADDFFFSSLLALGQKVSLPLLARTCLRKFRCYIENVRSKTDWRG